MEHIAQAENHIQRYADRSQLDPAHVAAVDPEQLRELKLSQAVLLAVKRDIQPEIPVAFQIGLVQCASPHWYYCNQRNRNYKPCVIRQMMLDTSHFTSYNRIKEMRI